MGGTKAFKVGEFLNKLIKMSSSKINTKLDKKLLRPVDVTLQIPSVRKFKKDTNWKPKVNLNDSLKKLLNEFRKQY